MYTCRCYSNLGVTGGEQIISIGPRCEHKGIVIHEIFHALGRIHEQSRTDRDNHIIINWENIKEGNSHANSSVKFYARSSHYFINKGRERQFKKFESNTRGQRYDYGSIMHYGAKTFTKNGKDTITTLTGAEIGQRVGLSNIDLMHVKLNYC